MRTLILFISLTATAYLLQGCETMSSVDKSLYSATRKTKSGARFDFSNRQNEIQKGEKAMNTAIGRAQAKGLKLDAEAVGGETYNKASNITNTVLSVTPAPYSKENWSARVIDDPTFNAFTTGGKSIVFHAGLLKNVNDCELAEIAGHGTKLHM